MIYSPQMTMIDRAPQREHEPAGHQGYRPQDIALSISSSPFDRVRTSSSESLPTLQEVTTWPAQMAYDAYHDADFTLAPTRGAFQLFSSGPHEELVTRSGRRDSSQGLLRGLQQQEGLSEVGCFLHLAVWIIRTSRPRFQDLTRLEDLNA